MIRMNLAAKRKSQNVSLWLPKCRFLLLYHISFTLGDIDSSYP